MTTCSRHAGARAAWRCENCQRTLCPDCAAHSGLANSSAVLCVHCGGLAQQLMVPRQRRPYWQMLPTFLKAIFSLEGVVQILAVSVAMVLSGMIPLIGPPLSKLIFISYYFRVILQAAYGAERLPEPSDFTDFSELFGPMLRFFMASLLIWLPALIYIVLSVGLSDFNIKNVSGTVIFLLVTVGVLYFPAAVIVAAISDSALAVITPAITVRMILRFPGEYFLTVAVWGFLNVLDGFLWINLMIWGNTFHIPIFVPIIVNMVGLLIPLLTGFILGRLIYQNAEHFKLLGKQDMTDLEWPDATPRGERPTQAEAATSRVAALVPPTPLDLPPPGDDLELGGPPEASAPALVEPLDLPDDDLEFDPTSLGKSASPAVDLPAPSDLPSPDVDPAVAGDGPGLVDHSPLDLEDEPRATVATGASADEADAAPGQDSEEAAPAEADAPPRRETMEEKLQRALRGDQSTQALKAYKAIRGAGIHPALPVSMELRLAGILEKVGQYEEAVITSQRAAKADMKGPFAARAIFTAARLMSEKLGNPKRGKELYQFVADNFPQDELSMYATDAIRKLERS